MAVGLLVLRWSFVMRWKRGVAALCKALPLHYPADWTELFAMGKVFSWPRRWLFPMSYLNLMLSRSFRQFHKTLMVVQWVIWSKVFSLQSLPSLAVLFIMWKWTIIGLPMSLPNLVNVIMPTISERVNSSDSTRLRMNLYAFSLCCALFLVIMKDNEI